MKRPTILSNAKDRWSFHVSVLLQSVSQQTTSFPQYVLETLVFTLVIRLALFYTVARVTT